MNKKISRYYYALYSIIITIFIFVIVNNSTICFLIQPKEIKALMKACIKKKHSAQSDNTSQVAELFD